MAGLLALKSAVNRHDGSSEKPEVLVQKSYEVSRRVPIVANRILLLKFLS